MALGSAGLPTLAARRDLLGTHFIGSTVPDQPLYPLINSRLIDIPAHYSLRSGSQHRLLPTRTDRFSKFVTMRFKPGPDKLLLLFCVLYWCLAHSTCNSVAKTAIGLFIYLIFSIILFFVILKTCLNTSGWRFHDWFLVQLPGRSRNVQETSVNQPEPNLINFGFCPASKQLPSSRLTEFIDRESPDGQTPLHYACTGGYEKIVDSLLRHGADRQALTLVASASPLHLAAKTGNLSVVELLVLDGAEINYRDGKLRTPLHR